MYFNIYKLHIEGRRGGLIVSVLDSGASSRGSGQGHCVVFLGKTLYSHSASLHPGVQMGTDKFNDGGNPAMYWHPIQGGVEILLVARIEWSRFEPWPGTLFCVLGQDTSLSQCLSLHLGVQMGTGKFNDGGNPATY